MTKFEPGDIIYFEDDDYNDYALVLDIRPSRWKDVIEYALFYFVDGAIIDRPISIIDTRYKLA